MSGAVAQVPDVMAQVVHRMYGSSPTFDHVFEEVHSMHEPSTVPIESNSCKNSQYVEKEISPVVPPPPICRSSRSRNPPMMFVDFLIDQEMKSCF